MRTFATSLLALLLVLAQPPTARADDGDTGTERTLLLLGPDGRPLEKIRFGVATESVEGRPVLTDDLPSEERDLLRGCFDVPGETEGVLLLWADGLATTVVRLRPGIVGLRLAPAAPLTGALRFDRLGPAADVELLAVPERALGVVHRTRTDEHGLYRFARLAPGRWELLVRRADGKRQSLGLFEAGGTGGEKTLAPGSVVQGDLRDGDSPERLGLASFEIRLRPLPAGRSAPPGQAPKVTTREDGTFVLADVAPGVWEAVLVTEGWFFSPAPPRVDAPFEGRVELRPWFALRARDVVGRVEGPGDVPLGGARIHLLVDPTAIPPAAGWPPVEAATADAEGRFRLRGLRPGRGYRLAIHAHGHAATVTEPFEVVGPAPTDIGVVQLARGWRLEVTLRSAGGAPVIGAAVRAVPANRPVPQESSAAEALVREAVTDAEGRAVLPDLPSDDVRAVAVKEGWTEAEALVPWPRSGDVRAWTGVMFAAPHLTGTLVPGGTRSLPALLVEARPRDGSEPREVNTDPRGRFRFAGLPAVPVDLVVRRAANRALPPLARLDGVVPGEVEDVRIVVPPPVVVTGRVVGVDPDGPPAHVQLEAPILDRDRDTYRWRTTYVQSLQPGRTRVEFALPPLAPGPYSVRAVQGGNDSDVLTFRVQEEEDAARLELELPVTGRVAGLVLDARDRPVLGADVRLVRIRGDGDAPGRGGAVLARASDADGEYAFEDVAPGLWRVEVRDQAAAPDLELLRVAEGEHVVVRDLRLDGGGTLEGVVWDGEGRTLDGARLELEAIEEGVDDRAVETGRDGVFRIEGLHRGMWRITLAARAGPFTALEALVDVQTGETTIVELTAAGRSRIGGRVMRRGRPVADATIYLLAGGDPPRRLVTRSDGDGRFAWDGLLAGAYEVDLVDGGLRATWPVLLEDGDDLMLDLEAWDGRIPGEVLLLSGAPVSEASVSARLRGAHAAHIAAQVRTDPEGRFLLAGLPSGTYDLEVSAPGLPPGRYVGAEAEVFGAERFVSITVGRGGTLELRVLDEHGDGVRSARVWLETPEGVPLSTTDYVTAPGGRLRVVGIPEADYRVHVHAARYGRPWPSSVSIREGEQHSLEVIVLPAARILATVRARHRDPVTRTRVDLLRLPDREPVLRRRPLGRVRLQPAAGWVPRTGALVIDDLGPGTYLLIVDAGPRFELVEQEVVTSVGEDAIVDIELTPR